MAEWHVIALNIDRSFHLLPHAAWLFVSTSCSLLEAENGFIMKKGSILWGHHISYEAEVPLFFRTYYWTQLYRWLRGRRIKSFFPYCRAIMFPQRQLHLSMHWNLPNEPYFFKVGGERRECVDEWLYQPLSVWSSAYSFQPNVYLLAFSDMGQVRSCVLTLQVWGVHGIAIATALQSSYSA